MECFAGETLNERGRTRSDVELRYDTSAVTYLALPRSEEECERRKGVRVVIVSPPDEPPFAGLGLSGMDDWIVSYVYISLYLVDRHGGRINLALSNSCNCLLCSLASSQYITI